MDCRIDIAEFELCAGKTDLDSLECGISLYKGEFLEGCYDNWCVAERGRLHELFIAMLQKLAKLYRRAGDIERALNTAQRWMQVDSFNEEVHAIIVASLAEKGHVGEARKAWDRYKRVWQSELNLQPSHYMWELAVKYSLIALSQEESKNVDGFATILRSAQLLTTSRMDHVPEAVVVQRQLRNQIIDHADQLGDIFKNRFAHAEALRHYGIALESLNSWGFSNLDYERAIGIRRKCDEVHDLSPSRSAQEQNLLALQVLAEKINEPAAMADVLLRRAWLDVRCNRFDSAIRFAQKASVLARELSSDVQALSLRMLGLVLFESDYYTEAHQSFVQAASLDEQQQNHIGLQADYVNLASVENAQSNFRSALKAIDHAHAIAELGSTPPLRMRMIGTKGQILTKLDHLDDATPFLSRSFALARNLGDYTWECWLAGRIADLYHRRHDTESAISLAAHYEVRARDLAESWSMVDLAEQLSCFYIGASNPTEAVRWAQRTLDVANASSFWRYQVRGSWRCAQAYLLLGDKTSAIKFVSISIDCLEARNEYIEERMHIFEFARSL